MRTHSSRQDEQHFPTQSHPRENERKYTQRRAASTARAPTTIDVSLQATSSLNNIHTRTLTDKQTFQQKRKQPIIHNPDRTAQRESRVHLRKHPPSRLQSINFPDKQGFRTSVKMNGISTRKGLAKKHDSRPLRNC